MRGLADARLALGAAAGRSVLLVSAPEAAKIGGALWFAELIAAAHATHAMFDAGEAPGHVLAALEAGLKRVRFSGGPAEAALLDIARQCGAEIVRDLPQFLDLWACECPEKACRDYLGQP